MIASIWGENMLGYNLSLDIMFLVALSACYSEQVMSVAQQKEAIIAYIYKICHWIKSRRRLPTNF